MTDKPSKVALNLDTLDREGAPEPYSFVLDGHPYQVTDPADLDWRVTASIGQPGTTPEYVMRQLLGEEQWKRFSAIKCLPDWKVGKLMEALGAHYGIGGPGEGDDSSGS